MKPRQALWVMLILLTFMPVVSMGANDKVRYRMQIFRISGAFSSKLSLEKPIWRGTQEDWDRIKDSVELFDKGSFQLGKDKLEIGPKGCFWNRNRLSFSKGDNKKLPTDKIKMISSGNIVRKSKELLHLMLTADQSFQYLSKREDGLFELQEMAQPVGLEIKVRAENKKGDFFQISSLVLTLRTVTEREIVPGVNLPIGRPLLHISKYDLSLFLHEDKSYGILLHLPGSGVIVIQIELDDK